MFEIQGLVLPNNRERQESGQDKTALSLHRMAGLFFRREEEKTQPDYCQGPYCVPLRACRKASSPREACQHREATPVNRECPPASTSPLHAE